MAAPGASCQRWMRTPQVTVTAARTNQHTVITGRMTKSGLVLLRCGGTLSSVMVSVLGVLATSATGTTVRALWVVALALVALAAVSRMKPATPRRHAVVRVDRKATPLHREPDSHQVRRAAGQLAGLSVVIGALLACIAGFALAVALGLVGDLLRS